MDKTNDPVSNDQLTSFHCVHCGKPHKELYKQYSKDVLKLSVCNFCGNSVDKYVEFDPVLIMIDVLLQRCEAYRHMIYNMEIKNLWKLGFIIIFCDSYRKWTNYKSLHKDMNYEQKFFALEYSFYSMFSESCFELTSYSVAVLLVIKILIHFNHIDLSEKFEFFFLWKFLILSCLGKIAIIFVIIWNPDFPRLYHLLFSLFVLTCNIQTLRVICNINLVTAFSIILAASLSTSLILEPLSELHL